MANVRILAITNADLEARIEAGLFRPDLYYRLKVVELTLPPLRERQTDIDQLAIHFVKKYARQFRKPMCGITADCSTKLHSYDWPGNVRELEGVITSAVLFSRSSQVHVDDVKLPEVKPAIQDPLSLQATTTTSFKADKAIWEANYLRCKLRLAGGNVSMAARLAGMDPPAMWRLLKRHHLLPRDSSIRAIGPEPDAHATNCQFSS